ncbi:hypothetical protein [Aestuariirhabdus litorea]|uniref:Uncharacterized protein n=1 Tax=Aestuariirhabdus litorea TaxID=2528527 RepID=A0A3P3VLP7_9GAMM|nr:hypothetical protein [Aestuariirhabdus litorea]RRJ82649.1 hypothetical protein D0544_12365 [Aestuariirhabdus litorea]RWW92810.1 hypothetical protein DZC74_12345 [Endozoicomonadaceae bacterium GTF-13]
MKLTQLFLATSLTTLALTSPIYANAAQDNGHAAMGHGSSASKMFLEKRDIDGYSVSFHVMAANQGMQYGGSHNLMIKVESQGKSLGNIRANSKVVFPDGKDQSKPLQKVGDWYVTGYDLKPGSKHQLMVLFMTADGKKHFGGVNYQ